MPDSMPYLVLVIGAFIAFAATLAYARFMAGNR
jgi:multisubunit Na+/H+ antiporter MnhF subunit